MDPRIIEVRKNIMVMRELDNDDTFIEPINIEFIPDEVVIKSILFTIDDPDTPDNVNTAIYTNLVSDYIGSFSDQSSGNSVKPNLVFALRRQINRSYEFTIHSINAAGNMELKARKGSLTIHLEFLKYKS